MFVIFFFFQIRHRIHHFARKQSLNWFVWCRSCCRPPFLFYIVWFDSVCVQINWFFTLGLHLNRMWKASRQTTTAKNNKKMVLIFGLGCVCCCNAEPPWWGAHGDEYAKPLENQTLYSTSFGCADITSSDSHFHFHFRFHYFSHNGIFIWHGMALHCIHPINRSFVRLVHSFVDSFMYRSGALLSIIVFYVFREITVVTLKCPP